MPEFYKYHGTGNDFIIMDDRGTAGIKTALNQEIIARLCHRHLGIGADGLILIREHPGLDFRMVYYNSDGLEGTMCGNGGRCAAAYARKAGIITNHAAFESIDGKHTAEISRDQNIILSMQPVLSITPWTTGFILDTGSPHFIIFSDNVDRINVNEEGAGIRNNDHFMPAGINVNFVEYSDKELYVRTYERGVERETLSCGTGIVASAICAAWKSGTDKNSYNVRTRGGNLRVHYNRTGDDSFGDIMLEGPAVFVYSGTIEL
jgi:diaminopimelate epimerase